MNPNAKALCGGRTKEEMAVGLVLKIMEETFSIGRCRHSLAAMATVLGLEMMVITPRSWNE